MAPPKSKSGTSRASRRADTNQADAPANRAEELLTKIVSSLGLVMLTRERIEETLGEAAERGRVTRTDANELVIELLKRGRQQTDELLAEIHRLLGSTARRTGLSDGLERLTRSAEAARRTVGVGSAFPGAGQSFPIAGYDELTAAQVQSRLKDLAPAQLRAVRDYERRHLNRKSVLAAIERALA